MGLSTQHTAACAQYLHKKHGIDQELFKRIQDDLVVLGQVGFEQSQEELASLRRYAKQFSTMRVGEQKHLLKQPKALWKHEKEELSLEANLIKLLTQARKELSHSQQQELISAITQVINRLQSVISLEEQEIPQAA